MFYTPSISRNPEYKQEERKRTTNERADENQEVWLITVDRKKIIPEKSMPSLGPKLMK